MVKPLVSIIMPCHDDSCFIKESISSVLAQTYENWELIVVDDKSDDDTIDVVLTIQDNRIKLYRNDTHMGAAFSRNIAIDHAEGKYIAFLDSDDFWYPNKLEKQVEFMETNGYLFSAHHYYEAYDNLEPKKIIKAPKKIGKNLMRRCNWVGCLSIMYNQEVLGKFNVDPNLKMRNDYALWLQIAKKTPCRVLPETLAVYRRNSTGISSASNKEKLRWEKEAFLLYATKSSLWAWVMAYRVGVYTAIKRLLYAKKLEEK